MSVEVVLKPGSSHFTDTKTSLVMVGLIYRTLCLLSYIPYQILTRKMVVVSCLRLPLKPTWGTGHDVSLSDISCPAAETNETIAGNW